MAKIRGDWHVLSGLIKLISIFFIFIPLYASAQQNSILLSDDKIKEILIKQSISAYPGNCPCPYFVDRAGRRCGKRSAWSKAGGYSPLCYPSDVTRQMIGSYRSTTGKE